MKKINKKNEKDKDKKINEKDYVDKKDKDEKIYYFDITKKITKEERKKGFEDFDNLLKHN